MSEVMIECPRGDLPELDGLTIVVTPLERLGGALEIVEVVATLSAAATPLIAAFLSRPSKSKTGKRRVVLEGQRKTFENYEADEIVRILEKHDESS